MKGLEFILLGVGALAGAFLRYKLVSSTIVMGTLPVNILIINVIGSLFLECSQFYPYSGIWIRNTHCFLQ